MIAVCISCLTKLIKCAKISKCISGVDIRTLPQNEGLSQILLFPKSLRIYGTVSTNAAPLLILRDIFGEDCVSVKDGSVLSVTVDGKTANINLETRVCSCSFLHCKALGDKVNAKNNLVCSLLLHLGIS